MTYPYRSGLVLLFCLLGGFFTAPAHAQCGQVGCGLCPAGVSTCGIEQITGDLPNAPGCLGLFCNLPVVLGGMNPVQTTATPQGGGNFKVRAEFAVDLPGNRERGSGASCSADIHWFSTGTPPANLSERTGLCHSGSWDKFKGFLEIGGLTCGNLASNTALKVYSASVVACAGGSCQRRANVSGIDLSMPAVQSLLGCPVPRKKTCKRCTDCISTGGGCGASLTGKGLACKLGGAGAHLYYATGGAGSAGLPGAAAWTPVLGRNWAHSYALRIVPDPNDSHVWLIEADATFREWSGLSGGVYGTVSPSDEKRTLRRTATGWELLELDGMVHSFDASGRWSRTADRNGNAKVGTYNGSGQLGSVSFPDGRSETFGYHASGKLASVTEVGVGGSPTRAWLYTWSGDDLVRVDRPDGTAWELFYTAGQLTRWDLIAPNLVRRIEGAWEYDASGNVIKAWRGDPVVTGPNVVDLYTFSYNNPVSPTQTQVTDPLGQVTTYDVARDTVSDVPKVTRIQGDCPACGVGPNAQLTYADPVNPLLPTQMTDGRGLVTQYAYNSKGQMTSKTEAAGTPLARTTTYQYGSASFPLFPTRIEMPSTSGGGALRATIFSYNSAGDLQTRTSEGAEAGSSFSYATQSTYNAAGQPLSIDLPGHGTADQTTYAYDPARGNLLPLTRTDPLVGATSFGYDGFNRQTTVTDPNGVQTVTTYDALNRTTSVTQKGATPAEDLVTTHVYNAFGDLLRTVLPRGNVLEYAYDPAGRLVSIERKPDATTPGERTLYTLDAYGHRIKEQLQRWDGADWVTESFINFVYSSRCHLDKTVHADGTATEYAYDCNGNLEKVWDANHPRVSNPNPTQLYTYDALNRLTSLTQPWIGTGGGTAVTSYGYDVQDHLTQVTDAEGNVTTYTYSDRDVMTQQVSPASGTTTYAYDEHGELVTEIDARGIVMGRSVDALDRVTATTYPNSELNIAYTYDDAAVPFSKGRLTRITRHGEAVDYRYDRFGRILQDGALAYGYDANGNSVSLTYPGGVEAVTTYDYADRPATLLARRAGHPDQFLVNGATYLPSGPLSSLSLGNGLTETHAFTARYFPSGIALGSQLSWSYSTDAVGNILSITDTLNAANNRTYGYQDIHYFLTQGNGPWGPRSWTYDKIGNRLTETRGAVTDTYTYLPNGAAGRTPQLSQIQLGTGGSRAYQFDPAGHLDRTALGSETTFFLNDAAGRLAALERPSTRAGATFLYDGRDYLSLADSEALSFMDGFETGDVCGWSGAIGLMSVPVCAIRPALRATYSSEGVLHSLHRNVGPQSSYVFYVAGRPIAQLDVSSGTETWKWLTTDHLGTPIAATGAGGALLWQGGFEPFGADWSGAAGAGVFLRFPGQWEEGVWGNGGLGVGMYYNVHRWYKLPEGRYTRPDPIGRPRTLDSLVGSQPEELIDLLIFSPPAPLADKMSMWRAGVAIDSHQYTYVASNPMNSVDPLGLALCQVFRTHLVPNRDPKMPLGVTCQMVGACLGSVTEPLRIVTAEVRRPTACKKCPEHCFLFWEFGKGPRGRALCKKDE